MTWLKRTYNLVFGGFLLSVLLVFVYTRPLNSPWDRLINGDGLGYYAYLPANYIYNDTHYQFKWFNEVFHKHYAQSSFPNPEDNFLVPYQDKKINKYYPGLSLVWLPFFAAAHLFAKTFGFPPDGFSEPYQWAIGLASLFYLVLGLYYLKRLIEKLFHNSFVSLLVPAAFFYGTALFTLAIRYNSLSHVYSFAFITLFLNALVAYFNDKTHRLRNLLLAVLWLSIVISIRPFNGVVVLLLPAFFPNGFFKERLRFESLKLRDTIIVALVLVVVWYQANINYAQTQSVFPFTYGDEKFHFDNSHFFEALIGYRIGLFVYMPLVFVAFLGLLWLPSRRRIVLPLFFLAMLFVYSCWWYWPIVKRTMVDFYAIPAIFLAALANRFYSPKTRLVFLGVVGLSVAYYQLKTYQISKGILDEFTNYKEIYWRNFFKLKKTNMFLIPPASILKKEEHFQDFERSDLRSNSTDREKYSGNCSRLLDSVNYIGPLTEAPLPVFFGEKGFKKVRASFYIKVNERVNKVHVFLQLRDQNDSIHHELPFYLEGESLSAGNWEYQEFGVDLADIPNFNGNLVNKVVISAWNVESTGTVYMDDVKLEMLLTDPSFEITK